MYIKPMNRTKIEALIHAISTADRVEVDGNVITYINTGDLDGRPENDVVLLSWEEFDLDYNIKLTEEGLDGAVAVDNELVLNDSEGDATTIKLFKFVKQNINTNW
jgi:hypothetical protein